jgi:peptide chain release factor subunit 1
MESTPKVRNQQTLTPLTEIDLRSLAEAWDERDVFLSIYMTTNIRDDLPFVTARMRAIEKALPRDLKEDFLKTREMVEPILAEPPVKGEKGRMIFASAPQSFMELYRVGAEVEPIVVWDSSPFLLPLARLRGDYEDYGLLMLDSQEARLFLVRSGILEEKDRAKIDLMNKHKKGGWSQMRYNRLRRGAIKSFLTQLIDDLQSHEDLPRMRGLVVAGPGEAKHQLMEMMPPALKDKMLGTADLHMETPAGDLLKLGDEISRNERLADSKSLAKRLKEAVLQGEPAAYGLSEVRNALEDGRVNHLLISEGFALPGMICMSCHHVHAEGEKCPTCGGEMAALQLEKLYEMAEKTGAEVVLVEDDEFLESIGHVGAILRY